MSLASPKMAAAGGRKERIVEGEFLLTHDDFRRIAGMLHADAGIALPETKATLVYSRLAKRLRALGLESFREYCALLVAEDGADERQMMMAALTTNLTRFFREPHHFDHLRTQVLPPLLAKARQGGRLRLWSAGCSTGQEPYSIALTILSLMPEAGNYDIRILATDIDFNVIAQARAGTYSEEAVSAIPAALRSRWLENGSGDQCHMGDEVRALIAFRELNLMGDWPMKGRFDAIFCRNVAIYFDEATQARLWDRFTKMLVPGGRLYIGHSERVSGPAETGLETDGLTTYRRKAA
jgi:chemotaxis protein methyltransferase CheR